MVAQYERRIAVLEQKESRTQAEEAHLIQYKQKIESNACNPLSFDSDERIAKAMEDLTNTVIESISIDKKSQENMANAHKMALET